MFSPKNVEYHLIGSLQDLQGHFHLSQLHLPKETISVVTDTRYVFQPITRLSKSKGKIEVIIKVGSQFVQVTTTKKQEIFAGLRLGTTVNDIFRLGEVDEAPTSIQTEDDSAFGLRADNGKIVMYFTSPKKADVLQTIRGAKAKHGKDSRAHKSLERLIRPQDVPGTLLNLALANLSSPDHILRLSSYNLLGALCKAFKFSSSSRLVCTKGMRNDHRHRWPNTNMISFRCVCSSGPDPFCYRYQQRACSDGAPTDVGLFDRILCRMGELS